jgi:hypothetical protein
MRFEHAPHPYNSKVEGKPPTISRWLLLSDTAPTSTVRKVILLGGLNALGRLSARLTPFTGGNRAKMSRDDISRDAPMTVEERRLLRALAICPFSPGSPHRGFCREILKAVTSSGRYRLTGDQRATLWRLGHHYRARLPREVQAILEYRNAPREKSQPGSNFPLRGTRGGGP